MIELMVAFITSASIGVGLGIRFKSPIIGAAAFVVVGLLYQILWAVSK